MTAKNITTVLSLVAALGLGASISAAVPPAEPRTPMPAAADNAMLSGEIASATSTSVTIKDNKSGTSKSVSLTSSTIITVDGRAAKPAELKAGQVATVTVEHQNGLAVAKSVAVRT